MGGEMEAVRSRQWTIKTGNNQKTSRSFTSSYSLRFTKEKTHQCERILITMNSEDIYAKVSERYGTTAKGSDAKYSNTVAKAFGYSEEELASIPKDANLGLSCGTPLATATLREVCSHGYPTTYNADDITRERSLLTWEVALGWMSS